jgi:hypothetical protein
MLAALICGACLTCTLIVLLLLLLLPLLLLPLLLACSYFAMLINKTPESLVMPTADYTLDW